MPTRESRAKRSLRQGYLDRLDWAALNIPSHVSYRLGESSNLSKNLKTKSPYNFGGYRFDDCGQPIRPERPGTANDDRHQDAMTKAKALRARYALIWSTPGAAGTIARLEGVSADSIRRYKRMLIDIA
jgi:hypothetical protein